MCTAEISTAVIVASLPGLKKLFIRSSTPDTTKDRSTSGAARGEAEQMSGRSGFKSRFNRGRTNNDDELELVADERRPSLIPPSIVTVNSVTRRRESQSHVIDTESFTGRQL